MTKYSVTDRSKGLSDQELNAKLESLPKAMQPQRDLWTGIERAIQHKDQETDMKNSVLSSKKMTMPMAWAASIIAAVLLTWYSFTPMIDSPTGGVLVNQQSGDKKTLSGSQLVSMMQVDFAQQKNAMLISFGQENIQNFPVKIQNQLAVLAQARTAIEKVLLTDENNVELLNLLRFTQQQELTLLQQLSPYMNDSSWQSI